MPMGRQRTSRLMAGALLLVICAGNAYTAIVAARGKPFWHDEIYTVLMAGLPTVPSIWAAASDGVDLQPPLNTLATRAVWGMFGVGPITTRLPALVGFSAMTIVIFVLLLRRTNVVLATAGALIPVQTAAFRYAYEARGYGLMLGLFALALLAWTEAAQNRHRFVHLPLLAVTLAAGVWTHYYALLAFALIGLGECVRQIVSRRLDVPMWIALAAATAALAPLVPLIRAAYAQSSTYWAAQAGEQRLDEVYAALMQPLGMELLSRWGLAIVVALAASVALQRRSRATRMDRFDEPKHARLPTYEAVVYAGALLLPLVGWLAGRFVLGTFTPRYGLAGVVGVALVLPLLVWRVAPRGVVAGLVLAAVVAVPFARTVTVIARGPRAVLPNPFEQRQVLSAALRRGERVVASDGLTFLPLWYYAPPADRHRLLYLAGPGEAARLTGSDTIDRGYLALARWTPVPIETFEAFDSRDRPFTVYAAGSGWLLDKLAEEGKTIELLEAEPGGRMYRVTP